MNIEEERYLSRELATVLRNKHAAVHAYFPVQELAQELELSCTSLESSLSRWHIALQLADHFKAPDRETFARSLLVPFYLLEPVINRGKLTGKKKFFFFERRESYSTWELANMFGVPEFVIDQQCASLYF